MLLQKQKERPPTGGWGRALSGTLPAASPETRPTWNLNPTTQRFFSIVTSRLPLLGNDRQDWIDGLTRLGSFSVLPLASLLPFNITHLCNQYRWIAGGQEVRWPPNYLILRVQCKKPCSIGVACKYCWLRDLPVRQTGLPACPAARRGGRQGLRDVLAQPL